MKQTNSKAEDSFEQARQEFFGSGEKIIKRTSPLPSSSRREAILAIQVVRPPEYLVVHESLSTRRLSRLLPTPGNRANF